jgi:hypothetical protein
MTLEIQVLAWDRPIINVREYRRGNHKCAIQKKLATKGTQYEETQKHNTICGGHHYTQANSYNVNKIGVPLQTPGCNDEPNIDRFNEEIVMDI